MLQGIRELLDRLVHVQGDGRKQVPPGLWWGVVLGLVLALWIVTR